MAGGRRIDDHSNWVGAHGKHAPLPEVGGKMKQEVSAEGAGHLGEYEDTTSELKRQQEMGVSKAHKHDRKTLHRN